MILGRNRKPTSVDDFFPGVRFRIGEEANVHHWEVKEIRNGNVFCVKFMTNGFYDGSTDFGAEALVKSQVVFLI